jgi:hypothetical protein
MSLPPTRWGWTQCGITSTRKRRWRSFYASFFTWHGGCRVRPFPLQAAKLSASSFIHWCDGFDFGPGAAHAEEKIDAREILHRLDEIGIRPRKTTMRCQTRVPEFVRFRRRVSVQQAPVPVRSSGRLQDRNLCVLEGNDGAGMQPHTCPER